MQMTVLTFISGNFQDDIDDELSENLSSLKVVYEQDLGFLISSVHSFFPFKLNPR